MLIWTSKSNLRTVYARFGRYKGVYALWWPDCQMGDKITRSTFYRHCLLQKGERRPFLPSPTTPKQSVLYRCPRYLRQIIIIIIIIYYLFGANIYMNIDTNTEKTLVVWPEGSRLFYFPKYTSFHESLNHFVADWSVYKAQFTTLETRRKLDQVNFRKDFWDRKKWPIADRRFRRVPSYDPTNNCGTRFGSNFLLLTQVANN